jgi:putative endonuclease
MSNTKVLGNWGERKAREYLIQQGVEVMAGNVRTPYGEIDLIGREGDILVFFEVKTRRSRTFGFPEQSIRGKKLEHMINSAAWYLQSNPDITSPWRIDVLALEKLNGQEPNITWFKNAVSN